MLSRRGRPSPFARDVAVVGGGGGWRLYLGARRRLGACYQPEEMCRVRDVGCGSAARARADHPRIVEGFEGGAHGMMESVSEFWFAEPVFR